MYYIKPRSVCVCLFELHRIIAAPHERKGARADRVGRSDSGAAPSEGHAADARRASRTAR